MGENALDLLREADLHIDSLEVEIACYRLEEDARQKSPPSG